MIHTISVATLQLHKSKAKRFRGPNGAQRVYDLIRRISPARGSFAYPLTLLATWVHEMGHGLTALATGGHFARLQIFADASGLAWTTWPSAWADGLVAAGGLVAPPILGAATLVLVRGPRRARLFLSLLAVALVVPLVAVALRAGTSSPADKTSRRH